jgi:hypothetical protein
MTFHDFYFSSQPEQIEIVNRKGVLIADRLQGDKKFVLYRVDAFYVELIYKLADNMLTGLRSFLSKLEPYLKQINISDIWE